MPLSEHPVHIVDSPGRQLAGLHVLEISQVLAGAYCGMLLADMGADVIKVERPFGGIHPAATAPHSLTRMLTTSGASIETSEASVLT